MKISRLDIDIDIDSWSNVLIDNFDESKTELFIRRKEAIKEYILGKLSVTEITTKYEISKPEIYRLLERCLTVDSNGEQLGYKGLIPYFRIEPYIRKIDINGFTESNKSGAFERLLQLYPDLKVLIDNLVLPNRKIGPNSFINRPIDIHSKFVKKCRELGISPEKGDYPFNSKDHGQRSLYRYVKKIKLSNTNKSVKDYGKDAATKHHNTGIGDQMNYIIRPFERVELDGHKIDAVFAIKYTNLEGDEVIDVISRIWVLCIIDCATSVTLGYHVCLGLEYTALDVMKCISNSIMPHKSVEFTIPGLRVQENGGFHSIKIPSTKYAIWDEISMDNAKANRANIVKEKNLLITGAHINYGPVSTPTRRPSIEKLFDLLESNGFGRLTNTTGNKVNDPRKNNPEGKAIEYEITPSELEQLIEVLIAKRNNSPLMSLGSLSPLEAMEQRINRNMPFRLLDQPYRDGVIFTTIKDKRTIRGSLEKGKRPYIQFYNVEYRNDVLAESYQLIGKELTIVVDIEDLRSIKAYLPDGSELGYLKAVGKWGIRKHSLKLRKTIMKLYKEKRLMLRYDDDPIEIYHNYLKTKAKHNKKARNEIAKIQSESPTPNIQVNESKDLSIDSQNDEKSINTNVKNITESINIPSKRNKLERFSFNS